MENVKSDVFNLLAKKVDSLQHMLIWGAEKAMLITMQINATAQSAFRSVGFADYQRDRIFVKDSN